MGETSKGFTREDIDVALVSALIRDQFPRWAHLPVRPVELDGWDNRTFRLGDEMSVRLPSAGPYAGQVPKEHEWLPRLGPLLPLQIPAPLAMGSPGSGYPWHWSVYRWLEGDIAALAGVRDQVEFAATLARFLRTLQGISAEGGPPPGAHNFLRGAPPSVYDGDTRRTLGTLRGLIDTDAAGEVWEAALASTWRKPPVWIHGDVAVGNLLVRNGKLAAVIDFGCSAVGDPACDLVIAWTFLEGESREAFRHILDLDEATWARGRGWALWKALITMEEYLATDERKATEAKRVIDEVLADHRRSVSAAAG